ncbi:MAG TPA: hypothetical protein DCM87_18620 [Planctomycetes bacterium]|nr:hypothetical protein [Planctomycetota bacterium]
MRTRFLFAGLGFSLTLSAAFLAALCCRAPAPAGAAFAAAAESPKSKGRVARSTAEVAALIEREGKTPPAWWDSMPLEYPPGLDLSWPKDAPGPWDAGKNVGQYIWSVINENPGKWRSGVRFLHHLLTVHKDNTAVLCKVVDALARMYCDLHQDYARAAFWWQQADKRGTLDVRAVARLADCYWQLGNKSMAVKALGRTQRYILLEAVKLWSEMGEIAKALALAEALARAGMAAEAYLAAGDACRLHGRSRDALAYYNKTLAVPAAGKSKEHMARFHARAQASIEAVQVIDALDLGRVPDGAYTAESVAYEAPLAIEVAVKKGRIESVKVTRHREKQFYSSIEAMPRRIVERQGVKGVDAVTGATVTSEAILNATTKALAEAMKAGARR